MKEKKTKKCRQCRQEKELKKFKEKRVTCEDCIVKSGKKYREQQDFLKMFAV